MINRRQFVTRMSLASAATVVLPKSLYSLRSPNAEEYVTVEITHGKIRGIRTKGVNIFKGIPYAGRISGDRRFRRPAPLEPWSRRCIGLPSVVSYKNRLAVFYDAPGGDSVSHMRPSIGLA